LVFAPESIATFVIILAFLHSNLQAAAQLIILPACHLAFSETLPFLEITDNLIPPTLLANFGFVLHCGALSKINGRKGNGQSGASGENAEELHRMT
jgi:hypothetical protein